MADIATLGLAVVSDQVDGASASLDRLTVSARGAEASTAALGQSSARAGGMSAQMTKALEDASRINARLGSTAALGTHQMSNLAFQLNDVATMAAMGADPLRILTSQVGQIYQILSTGQGGVRGSLSYIFETFTNMITPVRLLSAGIAAIGTAAVVAGQSWAAAQRETELALRGVGATSGMTADSIESISVAAADAGRATVGQAREMSIAFARTGRIGEETSRQLIALGKDASLVFGETMTETAARLGKAFADPAKGVDELNKQLLAFSAADVERIKRLDGQNQKLAAQQLMIDGVRRAIEGAAESTSGWSRAWDSLAETTSKYWSTLGNQIDRAMGGGTLQQRIEDTQAYLRDNRNDFAARWSGDFAAAEVHLRKLNEQLRIAGERTREDNLVSASLKVTGIAERIAPTMNQRSAMEADLNYLEQAQRDQAVLNKLSSVQVDTLNEAVKVMRTRVMWHQNAFDLAIEDQRQSMQAIGARTALEKAELAFTQRRAMLLRDGQMSEDQAVVIATMERNRVLKEAQEQSAQFARETTFQRAQNIEQLSQEVILVGKTSAQAAGLRAEWEAIAEAKRRAFETGTSVDPSAISAAAGYGEDVRGATVGRERRQLEQDQKSPAEKLADDMARLKEMYGADAEAHRGYLMGKTQAEYQAYQATDQLLQNERDMRTRTVEMAAGLLEEFGSKSKSAAIAAIVLNKALAMASIVQDTARASMAAAATAAAGGPVAVAAAVASMQALGATQLAIVAATGALQISQAGKKGGSSSSSRGGSNSSGGSSSSPAVRSSAVTATASQNVTINLVGSRYTRDEVRVLINSLNDTIRDGTELKVQAV